MRIVVQTNKNKMKKEQTTKTRIWYDFKTTKVKQAAQMYALKNGTSIQAMIEEAMQSKFPKLIKP